jgi:hypothetical protein
LDRFAVGSITGHNSVKKSVLAASCSQLAALFGSHR